MCGRFAQTNIIKATSEIVKSVIGKVDNIDNLGYEVKNVNRGKKKKVAKHKQYYKWEEDSY